MVAVTSDNLFAVCDTYFKYSGVLLVLVHLERAACTTKLQLGALLLI
jgi:hypothetical protein